MRYFKGTITISIEYSQPSILSTVLNIFLTLEFAAIQFCQRSFFQCISNTSHREINFLSKQLYFQNCIDYIEIRAATEAATTSTFSDQLLLEDK